MIRRISASDPRFRPLRIEPGFNLVLARRGPAADERDSTNSLGKTSLVDLLHFALGSEPRSGEIPRVPELAGWSFRYDIEVAGRTLSVERAVDSPKDLIVTDHGSGGGPERVAVRDWAEQLGRGWFRTTGRDREPTFRQLLRWFIRRREGDFLDAFDFLEGSVWSKRVAAAWLLGLAWDLPAEASALQEEDEGYKALQKHGAKVGLAAQGLRQPELEAERARLKADAARLEAELGSFRVHEQYARIEERASALTEHINRLSNENFADQRLLAGYGDAVRGDATDVSVEALSAMYAEAKVYFPERVTVQLEAVRTFHDTLRRNRERFLEAERSRLRSEIARRNAEIANFDTDRAPLIAVLKTDAALSHFSHLDRLLGDCRGKIAEVEARLEAFAKFDRSRAELKSRRDRLDLRALAEHEARAAIRARAQQTFSDLVGATYREEGRLILDDRTPKFAFRPEIPSIGGTGIAQLATACVDLTLARLWSERGEGPRLLVHDSRMFDAMDPRQRAATLAMAFSESRRHGYAYLALLNESEFEPCREQMPPEFQRSESDYVRLTLSDDEPAGSLFGFRFGG